MHRESHITSPPGRNRISRRDRFLFGTLIALGLFVAITFVPSDEVTLQFLLRVLFTLAGALLAGIWFFLLSWFSLRQRLLVGTTLLFAGAAAMASIRRIDFSGDLVPTLEFRWSTNPEDLLQAHRRHQRRVPTDSVARSARDIHLAGAGDSPAFRGGARDGVYPGPLLDPVRFGAAACRWRQPAGGGYSGFAVVFPFAVTLEQRGSEEVVTCYDVSTGMERWAVGYPAYFNFLVAGGGPRATPCIHNGKVLALGGTGELHCLDLVTGGKLWRVNVLDLAGVENLECGLAPSPLVHDSRVFIHVGAQGGTDQSRAVLALDVGSGQLVWSAGREVAGYSSPMLVNLASTPQLLIFDRGGLAGHDLQSGTELWRFAWRTDSNYLAAQPVVLPDDRIFASNGDGCVVFQVVQADGKWSATERWSNDVLGCFFASPVAVEGFLYGLDRGILFCVDLESGRRQWKKGRYGNGQVLRVGSRLIVQSETGKVALIEANPNSYVELAQFEALEGKTWNMPALAGGLLVMRNHREMAAYELWTAR